MLRTLIEKELKNIITGPKFTITFLIAAILIVMSVWIGIQDYRAACEAYTAGVQLVQQRMQETSVWMAFSTQIYRAPNPLQIFNAGISHDIGRFSVIRSSEAIKVTNSVYADDPIFAIFRCLDLSFIVQIVLSLLAILFTYDAINGEREDGTLRLVFSNALPRIKFILAKFIGAWAGLVIPLLVPLLLGFLLIQFYHVHFTGAQWLHIFIFLGIALLYFTFFIGLGILVSALNRHSAGSFLILLVIWVSLVLILPRLGAMLAGRLVPAPSLAEVEGQIDGYAKDRWNQYTAEIESNFRAREQQTAGMTPAAREAFNQENTWQWMEQNETARRQVEADIHQASRRLREELQNKKAVQERLALLLARFSPVSAFQLASMRLTGTDIWLKSRFENALEIYHQLVTDFVTQKQKRDGGFGGIQIQFDSARGVSISTSRNDKKLDLTDLPQFQMRQANSGEILAASLVDIGILLGYLVLALVGGMAAFLRYDVR
ncbi:ABC transporter permease subunit [candidate division KSB1 bacterium]|nr:ABC transporter permease subunit [candidate division KSB1 bacterium]